MSSWRLFCLSMNINSVSRMWRMHLMWNEWLCCELAVHSKIAESSNLTFSPTTTIEDLKTAWPDTDIPQMPQKVDCSWKATPCALDWWTWRNMVIKSRAYVTDAHWVVSISWDLSDSTSCSSTFTAFSWRFLAFFDTSISILRKETTGRIALTNSTIFLFM